MAAPKAKEMTSKLFTTAPDLSARGSPPSASRGAGQSEAFSLGASHQSSTSGPGSSDDLERGLAATDAAADPARGAVAHADSRAAEETQSERARGAEPGGGGGGGPTLAKKQSSNDDGKIMVRVEC